MDRLFTVYREIEWERWLFFVVIVDVTQATQSLVSSIERTF